MFSSLGNETTSQTLNFFQIIFESIYEEYLMGAHQGRLDWE